MASYGKNQALVLTSSSLSVASTVWFSAALAIIFTSHCLHSRQCERYTYSLSFNKTQKWKIKETWKLIPHPLELGQPTTPLSQERLRNLL